MVVGGAFTKVADSSRRMTFARKNIFAFGLHDGVIRTFAPEVDGAVYSLAAGPDYSVYMGGAFKSVNGPSSVASPGSRCATAAGTARSAPGSTGVTCGRWPSAVTGSTRAARSRRSTGCGRAGLARLNALSRGGGPGFDARLGGPGLKRTRVEHFDVSPDGRKLIAVGAFLKAGGRRPDPDRACSTSAARRRP